jgi:hypothetical protein
MLNVVWVYPKISSFSVASDEQMNEIDLLSTCWPNDSSQSVDKPPQYDIYHAYRTSTALLLDVPKLANSEESPYLGQPSE